VHVVVTAPKRDPEDVMDQFKAWCTRRLKELERKRLSHGGLIRQNWWTQRGGKRYLNDEVSLEAAIRYVLEGQGEPTPRASMPHKPEAQAKKNTSTDTHKPEAQAKDQEREASG
jgi:hypothetical protein